MLEGVWWIGVEWERFDFWDLVEITIQNVWLLLEISPNKPWKYLLRSFRGHGTEMDQGKTTIAIVKETLILLKSKDKNSRERPFMYWHVSQQVFCNPWDDYVNRYSTTTYNDMYSTVNWFQRLISWMLKLSKEVLLDLQYCTVLLWQSQKRKCPR